MTSLEPRFALSEKTGSLEFDLDGADQLTTWLSYAADAIAADDNAADQEDLQSLRDLIEQMEDFAESVNAENQQ